MENKKAVGDVFNIGTGKPTRIKELAEIMIKISNKKLEPEFAPAQIGDIRESYADITKATRLPGWEPRVSLEEGLRETMKYLRDALGGGMREYEGTCKCADSYLWTNPMQYIRI
ncbi:nucleoside-diphosphate-sugar epimerase [groundwater metagenome]